MSWGSPQTWVVGLDCRSMNLYRFLRVRFPKAPRGVLMGWIAEGLVCVNGAPVQDSRPLRAGDVVDIQANVQGLPGRRTSQEPQILLEDDEVLVVDKPAGMAAAPERSPRQIDLQTWLKRRETATPKLVHRVDKGASGVVVYAKTRDAKRGLVADFARRRVVKDYLGVVAGAFPLAPQSCELALNPARGRRTRVQVTRTGGKECQTLLRGIWSSHRYTTIHARPVTSRTHQIRAHLRHLGHSLVGDDLYGGEAALYLSQLKPRYRAARGESERPILARLALHAYRIEFPHPATGEPILAVAPLPTELQAALRQLHKAAAAPLAEGFPAFLEVPVGPRDAFAELLQSLEEPGVDPDLG